MLKLSDLLAKVKPAQQFGIYKRFKAAIRDGKLDAVPTEGTIQVQRTKSPLAVPEYAVSDTAYQWLESELESMSKPKSASRRLSVSLSDLESGRVDFAEAVKKYRASLQPKTQKRSRRPKEE